MHILNRAHLDLQCKWCFQEILVSRSPDLYQRQEVLNYPQVTSQQWTESKIFGTACNVFMPSLYQLQPTQEVLYEGDQCLLAPSPPPLLIPASSVTPVTPPFSLDSICPPTTQNSAQVPRGKLSPAEVKSTHYLEKITLVAAHLQVQQLLLHLPAPQPPAPLPPPSPTIQVPGFFQNLLPTSLFRS